MTEELLARALPDLDGRVMDQLVTYAQLLLEWNTRMNLTRITEPSAMAWDHFADSLAALPHLPQNAVALDLGTGAGFPGLPLAIARPDVQWTLNDAQRKKLTFIQAVVERLGIRNVITRHARAEQLGQDPNFRESFDIVCARAVAPLRILAEYCLPLVKVSGSVLAYKAAGWREESEQAASAIRLLGGGFVVCHEIPPPPEGWDHVLLTIPKSHHTPREYPRKAGTVAKSPL